MRHINTKQFAEWQHNNNTQIQNKTMKLQMILMQLLHVT